MYGIFCEVFTNNHNLHFIFNHKDMNLRQCRQLELVRDSHDKTNLYHPSKANAIEDALDRKGVSMDILALSLDEEKLLIWCLEFVQ